MLSATWQCSLTTDVPDFVDTFSRFLRDVVDQHERRSDSSPLTAVVDRHLGCTASEVAIVTEQLSRVRLADADVAPPRSPRNSYAAPSCAPSSPTAPPPTTISQPPSRS